MVEPFIDPLDVEPIHKSSVSSTERRRISSNPNPPKAFEDVLAEQTRQKPTPVLTAESLSLNALSVTPKAGSSQSQDNKSASNPVSSEITESEPKQSNKDVSQHIENQKVTKQNLMELLKVPFTAVPMDSKPVDPSDSKSKTDSTSSTEIAVVESKQTDIGTAEETSLYKVKRGDTLSEIVASELRAQDIPFRTADIYRLVTQVANRNGIQNPDYIRVGQTIDLSSIISTKSKASVAQVESNLILDGFQVPATGRITSGFGMRVHPIFGNQRFHNGIDLALETGTPINPVKAGTVVFSGTLRGYGETIEIDHGDGTQSLYGHLSQRNYQTGEHVEATDRIGLSGNTGISTGPHLQLEIHQNGRPIDPLTVLPQELLESSTTTV